ncbi:Na/Pi cotransporter family protein [Pseudohalioglobus lutimaris]|uniref:Na(+)/phosphate symporter n=1 Tax=Pseudohalioglobus lutimaris TaxID=1737061 RepID=A0A2N5X4C8_9GAMM|nr:Na/Pi cotransporter family protein [Pseudohalioglobus lutimaris]PLW69322.1 Na(+)/phosphate symporter [Pseudohalioglobus lutimaris]
MENLSVLFAGITAVVLFIFGLENFSKEIEKISGEQFRRSLSRATNIPLVGALIGAAVTAVIQSSSATSVITISLVNAGVLSFKNSVGIVFGANVGTTVTAQLVAFKLTAFAPLLIVVGFAISLSRSRASIFGKSIFYFGFVFFSLNLISSALQPLQNDPDIVRYLANPQNPLIAIFIGFAFTALVQSSSVTTGLAIVLTQQGLIGLENAVPIIMGANIGTTTTAMLAMFNMDLAAKKTAFSHFLFNLGGVLLFLPAFLLYGQRLNEINMEPAVALATIHLIFNLTVCLVFLLFINPFTRFVDKVIGEGRMDFERIGLPKFSADKTFDEVEAELQRDMVALCSFLQENYNLVTLSVESNYKSVHEAAEKRIAYIDFLEREYIHYFSQVVASVTDQNQSKQLLATITRFDYLFQIHDSIEDLFNVKRVLSKQYIELRSDVLLMVRELSSATLGIFDEISSGSGPANKSAVAERAHALRQLMENVNRQLLVLLARPDRKDVGSMINFVTYSRRLADKLLNFAHLNDSKAGLDREENA